MAVTLETDLSRVLGAKTAKAMAESLDLRTVRDLPDRFLEVPQ